jgi:hypothetical protein
MRIFPPCRLCLLLGVVTADADYEDLETGNGAIQPPAEEGKGATTRPAVPEEQTDRMDALLSRPCRGFWPAKVIIRFF